MTPRGINHAFAHNLPPQTTRCGHCQRDVPANEHISIRDPRPQSPVLYAYQGCLDCLMQRQTTAGTAEVPYAAIALISQLWHLVTQPHSAAEVDAAAVEMQRVLRGTA